MALDDEQQAAIRALYDELPRIDCQRKCAEACGPIAMTLPEKAAMEAAHGQVLKPMTMKRLQQEGGTVCPLLKDGLCSIYDARPAICRLWGVVEDMPCVFGCQPERLLTDEESRAWLDRLYAVAGRKWFDFMPRQLLDQARRARLPR